MISCLEKIENDIFNVLNIYFVPELYKIVDTDIVNLCGDLPRIELFARHKIDGWDAWGNEI